MDDGASTPFHRPVRISRLAGRYLVFDADQVSLLRRYHGAAVMLVGTAPQHPTQNTFLSLPAELAPEEARLLVDQGVASIVDEAATLPTRLRALDPAARAARHDSLRWDNELAQRILSDQKKQKQFHLTAVLAPAASIPASASTSEPRPPAQPVEQSDPAPAPTPSLAVTPTTDTVLFSLRDEPITDLPPASALFNHLRRAGYYLTPGLRFGARYSVYPGDPLRFHAHFLANEYGWHDDITVLDLVANGRLATGVKKSFLFGASDPAKPDAGHEDPVRVFSLEWAGM